MTQVLDPRLLALVELASTGAGDGAAIVEVVVGLDRPLDDEVRKDLVSRGLTLRSQIGDVLTGVISLNDVGTLAASPRVLKIEAGAPMHRESGNVRRLPTG